jgi:uncharacterized protein
MAKAVAAITGASSGLGAVFARKLAARGFDLLLVARRADRLEKLAEELQNDHSTSCSICTADLSRMDEIQSVATEIAAEPRLEILVNNAGFGLKGLFAGSSIDGQTRMHRVHIDATMRLTHAALAGMTARNRGGIINVASVAGFFRSSQNVSYCATKAWINAFTEGLYLELKDAGSQIVVQSLCPGFTYTDFHESMGVDRNTVAKWLWMNADDVVEASLDGLTQRKLFVIPGWRYSAFVALATKFPVSWRLKLEGAAPHRKAR